VKSRYAGNTPNIRLRLQLKLYRKTKKIPMIRLCTNIFSIKEMMPESYEKREVDWAGNPWNIRFEHEAFGDLRPTIWAYPSNV
jgi:hypothetical protein